MPIDFDRINTAALSSSIGLLQEWFPAGRMRGREFTIGSLQGEQGDSLSINVDTGKWADFATDERGGDLTSLNAARLRVSQVDAARDLAEHLGVTDALNGSARAPAPAKRADPDPVVMKPLLEPLWASHAAGEVTDHYDYHDADGVLVGRIYRVERGDEKNYFPQWQGSRKGFPQGAPLYGLPTMRRPTPLVIACEGEKAARAAAALLPKNPVVSAAGNAWRKADLSPLAGRRILYWPDADEAGLTHARRFAEAVGPVASVIHYIDTTGLPDKFDAADYDTDRDGPIHAWFRKRVVSALPEPPAPDPAPAPAAAPSSRSSAYVPLGYQDAYYYVYTYAGVVRRFTAKELASDMSLAEIAPWQWWQASIYWVEGGNTGPHLSARAAARDIMAECVAVGIYDPARLRHRGAWLDRGRVVINAGDYLLVDGTRHDVGWSDTTYIYHRGHHLMDVSEPLTVGDVQPIVEILSRVRWANPLDARLFAGWLVTACLCGVMDWRTHIWVTGGSGSGKSTLIDTITKILLGRLPLSVEGNTTEAAIRQGLAGEPRPVIFDEAESGGQRARERMQQISHLMRTATDRDGSILKGSTDGRAVNYLVQSQFLLASINTSIADAADLNRCRVMHLRSAGGTDGDWPATLRLIADTLTPDFVARFISRAWRLAAVVTANEQVFQQALLPHVGTMRLAKLYANLAAGAYSYESDDVITRADADAWCRRFDWTEETRDITEQTDERQFMEYLMTAPLRGRKGETWTLAEAIDEHSRNKMQTRLECDDTLERHGLKVVGEWLYVHTTNPQLKKTLADTPWANSVKDQVSRCEGYDAEFYGQQRMMGQRSKCRRIKVDRGDGGYE